MNSDLTDALQMAAAFLRGEGTPLELARRITRCSLSHLPCWNDPGGAKGPLSKLYEADDEADQRLFLGDKVEMWHSEVRERKRAELLDAEERWREPVDKACLALIQWAAKNEVHLSP